MREQGRKGQDKEWLVKGLKEKLEWYTMCASDAEFDEKAVESILYLLEHLDPLEKAGVPEKEGAWESFQAFVRERDEKNLPEMEEIPGKPEPVGAERDSGRSNLAEVEEIMGKPESLEMESVSGKPNLAETEKVLEKLEFMVVPEMLGKIDTKDAAEVPDSLEPVEVEEFLETVEVEESLGKSTPVGKSKGMEKSASTGVLGKGREAETSEELGVSVEAVKRRMPARTDYSFRRRISRNLAENQKGAVVYNKYIVAAVLLLLVISIVGAVGNVTVGASPDTGFFHWLKRDNTGIQMVVSPEDLDRKANVQEIHNYYDKEDMPDWTQEWLKIDAEFEFPESYGWLCYEIEEGRNFHKVASFYMDTVQEREVLLGMIMYHGDISLNTEVFVGYNYIDSYEASQQQMNVYNKQQESGKEYFIISFYEKNYQYFMQGQDLDELKGLIEQYWLQVKNNLKENEIICNKMLSQAIYK